MPCTSTGSSATLFENGMYIGLNLQDVLYGIELVLYFKTMHIFLARRKQHRKSDAFYGFFSTLMITLITIWVFALGTLGQKMWLRDRNHPGGPMAYYSANTSDLYLCIARVALTSLQQFTDALMIYRCHIVWGKRSVILVPSILWLANVGLGILLNWTTSTPGMTFFRGTTVKIGLAYHSVSAFLNVILSCMICYRLLRHAHKIKQYLGDRHASPYLAIVALVVESVLPQTLSAIGFLVLYGMGSPAVTVFSYVHPLMMCISPQMLILRVAKGEAWQKDESGFSDSIIRFPSEGADSIADGTSATPLDARPPCSHSMCQNDEQV